MSSAKDIRQRVTRPLQRAGWDVTMGGSGHAIARIGEHTIPYTTTPSDWRSVLNVLRWVKQCRDGRCDHGGPPAKQLESKPRKRKAVTMQNRIASTRWTKGGRLLVRVVGARAGKQMPYDIVVTPTDESVWEGHLLTEGDDAPPVILDFDKGEAVIGSLTVNGLPLDEIRRLRPDADEAAALTGRTTAGVRAAVKRGDVKAGPPRGAKATVMRSSVEAWAGKRASVPREKPSAPIPATPTVRKGKDTRRGGEGRRIAYSA